MNELQEFENLLRGLLQAIEQVIASGEILSDEFQGELANTINLLWNRIEALRVTPTPQPTPELPPAEYPSSNIHAFRYDPQSQKLFIQFQDKYPQTNGPVYEYGGVPQYIFEVFRRGAVAPKTSGRNKWHTWKKGVTPSLGASAYALIRLGGFPYQRVR